MAYFLMASGLLCIWAGLHPFSTYPLSLVVLRKWRRRPLPRGSVPKDSADARMAVLMCAYNEERVIEAKLENLLSLQRMHPGLAIYVYVDAASDRTAQLVEPYRDRIFLHVAPERMGKTYGMNLLMAEVSEPIVVFTDANVMIDEAAPARLLRYFSDPQIGCVCGHLRYTNARESVTASSGSLYWRLDEWTKRLETATGSAMGADGSLFAIRRSLHKVPPVDMFDDIYVSMMVLCQGSRVVQADDVIAYEESVPEQHEEFQRKIRIGCQAFNAHLILWPAIKRLDLLSVYKYVSHKWLRWLTIFFFIAGGVLVEAALCVSGHVLVAAGLLALALASLLAGYLSLTRVFSQIWDILTAFAGTGLGVLKSLRGHRFQTWTPASSIRK